MKYILIILFLIYGFSSSGQDYLDKNIIITVDDTAGLYQKVRIALGKNNFQIKEDGNYDTLTTFPRESKKIPGFVLARAVIKKDTVAITGIYGFIRMDYWGYTRTPNSYKEILYMKKSKLWPLLMKVANELNGKITYSK
ncbi:MAG: hypothetical protein ACTHOF_12685 [Flavisolibacter sp.]